MRSPARPVVCLVTPGTRDANNGNWRTAARWAAMLRDRYRVIVQTAWDGSPADALIALHARRSADSVARFRDKSDRVGVVLTGTDLYRDLERGPEAARSLDAARRIVVLQEDALKRLTAAWRRKCEVVFQSARTLKHRARSSEALQCIAVGHLREEKDPLTIIRAFGELPPDVPVRLRHIGAPLDERLADAARALAARDPRYAYAGPLPHGLARSALAAADVLVHPSIMEGGANVIVEAVTAGTPVIASRISGNIGMLGPAYAGYFEAGDARGLARLLRRALEERAFLASLRAACRKRKPLFAPRAETDAVRRLAARLLDEGAG